MHISYFVPPAPLLAAQERGLLNGLELEETRTPGSAGQLDGLISGRLDLAVTAIDNLFEWSAAGADLRLLGQVEPTTPLSLFAAPVIADASDLEELPVGVDAYANGFSLVARHYLQQAGAPVRWLEVGGVAERLDALLSGAVSATLLGPPFDERARAAGFRELMRVQDHFPEFPGQGLVARAELVGTPALDRLLASLSECGLQPVEAAGLDLLIGIREQLGLLPREFDLHATVVHP